MIILFCSALIVNAQTTEISVNADNEPLSEILKALTVNYNFQLSYNASELSEYSVTVHRNFKNAEKTIRYLLRNLPLKVISTEDVYIILHQKTDLVSLKQEHCVYGQIIESGSNEPLPHSQIMVNGRQISTDVLGNFRYISMEDSVFHLQASHLGYFIVDTVLSPNVQHVIALESDINKLPEVVVKNNVIEKSALVGSKPGNLKLNYEISRFLPGKGDNSVFTLLKLMPGIQATGEQSEDLVIWGSYEGQSLITFDEFTLFGLRNYNENINVVNPFIIKSIEIDKGGYEAKYGNRVGGLVNITGKNGNRLKPNFTVNLNLSTINGMAEIPLFRKSSLILAYRQTYYNLYDLDDFNVFSVTHSNQDVFENTDDKRNSDPDISVFPDKYNFRDFNIKYSHEFNGGDVFYVSYYRGGDVFSLETEAELERANTIYGDNRENKDDRTILYNVELSNDETNKQQGFSSYYSRKWKNGNLSKLMFAYADFSKKIEENVNSSDSDQGAIFVNKEYATKNKAIENSIRSENIIFMNKGYKFEFGGGLYFNRTEIRNNNNYTDNSNLDTLNRNETYRGYLFAQQSFPVTKNLKLLTGVRANHIFNSQKFFTEPRVSVSYKFSDAIKAHASWGLFNQIMYKIATVDNNDNYTYLWTTGNDNTEGLNATHWITGINYNKKDLTINLEGYYKSLRNLSRRYYAQNEINGFIKNEYQLYSGNARTYGMDLYVRKDFGFNTIWASYSLSRAEEQLSTTNEPLPDYSLAPQDQRHEFKIASLVNINNFYFSASYIYGSGMEVLKEMFDTDCGLEYNRVDVALTYNLHLKKMNCETGVSVLNLFDTQNLTPRNVKSIDISEDISPITVYTDAVPFTPIFFVKARF